MKNTVALVSLGLLAFLIFLLITAPATLLTRPLSERTPVRLDQVAGSIWQGEARDTRIMGVPIGVVAWDIHAWKLLSGKLAVTLQIGGQSGAKLSGLVDVSLQLPGKLVINDSKLLADAEWVAVQAALPMVPKGQVQLDIQHFSAQGPTLPEIDAELKWLQAGVTYPNVLELGEYQIKLKHEPAEQAERIVGQITDIDSLLHIKGNGSLDQQWRYQVNVNVSAESYAPAEITQMLPFLGRPNPDGSVDIKRNGALQSLL